jgi:HEPN domain-containing protein
MSPLSDNPLDWLEQAELDIQTAERLLAGNTRYYSVFFCHIAIEKALKGLYFKKLHLVPPKIHNHFYFLKKLDIKPPEKIFDFLSELEGAHIATRYPEDFTKLQNKFTPSIVLDYISLSKETLEWIKTML